MKLIIVPILIAAATPLSAGETSMEALRSVSFNIAATAPAVPEPAEPKAVKPEGLHRSYCWARGPQAMAESAGMPGSFCVAAFRVLLRVDSSAVLSLQGDLAGEYPLQIKSIGDGLYSATAAVFRRYKGSACTDGSDAVIEITVKIDARGAIIEEPVLKAFYGENPDVCHSSWDYTEILYSRR